MDRKVTGIGDRLAECLKEALPAVMERCSEEMGGLTPCRQVPSVLSALVGLASGAKSSFWEDLLTPGSCFSALGEALSYIERNSDIILPCSSDDESIEICNAFRELTNTVRADLMRLFQSVDANLFMENDITGRLPLPLYFFSKWVLTPVNHAARVQLVSAQSKLCHKVFFDADSPCPNCPIADGPENKKFSMCPELEGRKGLFICPYTSRRLLVFPRVYESASSSEPPREVNTLASGLLDHLGTGVVFADSNGLIVYSNSAARELLDRDPVGRKLDEVIPGAGEADDTQKHLKLKRGAGPTITVGYRSQSCIFEREVGTIVTFRDIGDIVTKNQMRRLSEIGRMTATVAHEVRNPLAGILATMQSVETEMRAARLGDTFEIIQGEVERLTDLLDSFFTFVRDKPSRRMRVFLKDLVEGSIRSLGARAEHVDVGYLPAQPVKLDPLQMKQVLINLLANGVDALRSGKGRVTVSAELDGEDLKLWVRDDGAGMTSEVLANAVEPFFSTKHTGTGLGLSVCYQLVEAHGGAIHLESSPGAGTLVEIYLPGVLTG